ncbi:MAG: SDR family oxidoreductase [Gammaproteobacteria bacterium]|nr:SDR family oxidoreductase [Gammaproteobacteria bacterium]
MTSLKSQIALVTGAAGGIGLAIAEGLAANGANVILAGRQMAPLETAQRRLGSSHTALVCDLSIDTDLRQARDAVVRQYGRLDILVHSAGVIIPALLEATTADDFDRHYRVNVRAPLFLTQALLPQLKQSRGQIVFINSSVGVRIKEGVGAYAASKHALKAIADTLRAELNADGVRVLSVFPGNTATAMQQKLHDAFGKSFQPDTLLQPGDVAALVMSALQLPRTAEVTDIHVRPAYKA